MIVLHIPFLKSSGLRPVIGQQMRAPAGEGESFQSDSKIAVEKILNIDTATPGMIATEEAIVRAKDLVVVRDLSVGAVALSPGERISTPDAHGPFLVAIPFRAGSRLHLFHFLPGIALGTGNGDGNDAKKGD